MRPQQKTTTTRKASRKTSRTRRKATRRQTVQRQDTRQPVRLRVALLAGGGEVMMDEDTGREASPADVARYHAEREAQFAQERATRYQREVRTCIADNNAEMQRLRREEGPDAAQKIAYLKKLNAAYRASLTTP
jgi:hypothetical protein